MVKWRKRSLLVLAIISLMAFAFAGCGSEAEPENGTEEPGEEPPAEGETVEGGHLKIATYQEQDSLDANVWTSSSMMRWMTSIYDPLVWEPEPGEFQAGLAEDWEVSDDYTEYTFHLRDDVTFHNGEEFTAEAVKFTLDRIVDPEAKSLRAGELSHYEGSEIIDEYTVKVTLSEPDYDFLSLMANHGFAPCSPQAVEEKGSDYAIYPVGAGPFKVEEWPDSKTVVFTRFDDYNWAPEFMENEGRAHLEKITVRMIEEDSTRSVALETGDVDYMDEVPSPDLEGFQQNTDIEIVDFVLPGLNTLLPINVQTPPTDELAVRQAILYSVDQATINNTVHQGYQEPAYGPISSSTFGYWDGVEDMYPTDPDKAREVLEEAGWSMNDDSGYFEKDGETLEVDHITSSQSAEGGEAEMVQAMLEEAGIKVNLRGMAYEARAELYANDEYNIARIGWPHDDPIFCFNIAFHSKEAYGGGQFNRSRVEDEHIDDLIAQAESEPEPEERVPFFHELQEYIMDEALVIPAIDSVQYGAMSTDVKNFTTDNMYRWYLYEVWLDR